MVDRPDLLILGAGPAGVGAALAASECGVEAVIVDRAPSAGGQVFREPWSESSTNKVDTGGNHLRRSLAESTAKTVFGCNVWSVGRDFRVDGIDSQGHRTWQSKAIVAALGTTERVVPFPGWTLPGVYGLAATTLLLKSQSMLPGANTVVAGSGPLLAAIAHGILTGGGKVAAIIDIAGRGEWLGSVPALLSRPKDLRRGWEWARQIKTAGIPIFHRHAVHSVTRTENGLAVVIEPVDRNGQTKGHGAGRTIQADSLSIGNGLTPSTELTRLLGAVHEFKDRAGGWVPQFDSGFRTTVDGLYAAGDGAGVTGADAASLEGRIAGYSVARDTGRVNQAEYERLTSPLIRRLTTVTRAGRRMAELMALRQGQVGSIEAETIVCRCEDITRREIDAAIDSGATDLNQLKSWTRCGMGPCQGRTCGDVVAAIVATRRGGRAAVGCWSPRTPLNAITMGELTGDFTYADIPLPVAAPL